MWNAPDDSHGRSWFLPHYLRSALPFVLEFEAYVQFEIIKILKAQLLTEPQHHRRIGIGAKTWMPYFRFLHLLKPFPAYAAYRTSVSSNPPEMAARIVYSVIGGYLWTDRKLKVIAGITIRVCKISQKHPFLLDKPALFQVCVWPAPLGVHIPLYWQCKNHHNQMPFGFFPYPETFSYLLPKKNGMVCE